MEPLPNIISATIERGNPLYPACVEQTVKKPPTLYARGNVALLTAPTARLAVVGSRRTTPASRSALTYILKPLNGVPLTIVSGLALGLDALAHEIALSNNLPTIAVLGSPVSDREIYPRTNFMLAQKILASRGLLLSPFAPGTPTMPFNFPARNQIIAALSTAVLVASAAATSGALITARFALDYGRDVLVIPGYITDPLYAGSNTLLKEGAILITSTADLADNVNVELQPAHYAPRTAAEEKILNALHNAPRTVDELTKNTGLTSAHILSILSELELRAAVQQTATGFIRIS